VPQSIQIGSGISGMFGATALKAPFLYGALTDNSSQKTLTCQQLKNLHEFFLQHGATHGQGKSMCHIWKYNLRAVPALIIKLAALVTFIHGIDKKCGNCGAICGFKLLYRKKIWGGLFILIKGSNYNICSKPPLTVLGFID
jgi:hypothetical protein